MITPPCSNKGCSNKIDFYHICEENYYWENCACLMFKEEECERIGDYNIIKQLIVLCKELLEEILNYANEEMLNLKWKSALQIQKTFALELIDIKKSFDGAINNWRLKDLRLLQKRLISLKSQFNYA